MNIYTYNKSDSSRKMYQHQWFKAAHCVFPLVNINIHDLFVQFENVFTLWFNYNHSQNIYFADEEKQS